MMSLQLSVFLLTAVSILTDRFQGGRGGAVAVAVVAYAAAAL